MAKKEANKKIKVDKNKNANTKRDEEKINIEKKEKKEKKGFNIFKAIKNYFGDIMTEMKKVRWPSGNSMVKYSIATIVMVIFFCVVFYLIDLIIVVIKMVI